MSNPFDKINNAIAAANKRLSIMKGAGGAPAPILPIHPGTAMAIEPPDTPTKPKTPTKTVVTPVRHKHPTVTKMTKIPGFHHAGTTKPPTTDPFAKYRRAIPGATGSLLNPKKRFSDETMRESVIKKLKNPRQAESATGSFLEYNALQSKQEKKIWLLKKIKKTRIIDPNTPLDILYDLFFHNMYWAPLISVFKDSGFAIKSSGSKFEVLSADPKLRKPPKPNYLQRDALNLVLTAMIGYNKSSEVPYFAKLNSTRLPFLEVAAICFNKNWYISHFCEKVDNKIPKSKRKKPIGFWARKGYGNADSSNKEVDSVIRHQLQLLSGASLLSEKIEDLEMLASHHMSSIMLKLNSIDSLAGTLEYEGSIEQMMFKQIGKLIENTTPCSSKSQFLKMFGLDEIEFNGNKIELDYPRDVKFLSKSDMSAIANMLKSFCDQVTPKTRDLPVFKNKANPAFLNAIAGRHRNSSYTFSDDTISDIIDDDQPITGEEYMILINAGYYFDDKNMMDLKGNAVFDRRRMSTDALDTHNTVTLGRKLNIQTMKLAAKRKQKKNVALNVAFNKLPDDVRAEMNTNDLAIGGRILSKMIFEQGTSEPVAAIRNHDHALSLRFFEHMTDLILKTYLKMGILLQDRTIPTLKDVIDFMNAKYVHSFSDVFDIMVDAIRALPKSKRKATENYVAFGYPNYMKSQAFWNNNLSKIIDMIKASRMIFATKIVSVDENKIPSGELSLKLEKFMKETEIEAIDGCSDEKTLRLFLETASFDSPKNDWKVDFDGQVTDGMSLFDSKASGKSKAALDIYMLKNDSDEFFGVEYMSNDDFLKKISETIVNADTDGFVKLASLAKTRSDFIQFSGDEDLLSRLWALSENTQQFLGQYMDRTEFPNDICYMTYFCRVRTALKTVTSQTKKAKLVFSIASNLKKAGNCGYVPIGENDFQDRRENGVEIVRFIEIVKHAATEIQNRIDAYFDTSSAFTEQSMTDKARFIASDVIESNVKGLLVDIKFHYAAIWLSVKAFMMARNLKSPKMAEVHSFLMKYSIREDRVARCLGCSIWSETGYYIGDASTEKLKENLAWMNNFLTVVRGVYSAKMRVVGV